MFGKKSHFYFFTFCQKCHVSKNSWKQHNVSVGGGRQDFSEGVRLPVRPPHHPPWSSMTAIKFLSAVKIQYSSFDFHSVKPLLHLFVSLMVYSAFKTSTKQQSSHRTVYIFKCCFHIKSLLIPYSQTTGASCGLRMNGKYHRTYDDALNVILWMNVRVRVRFHNLNP